MLVLDGCRHLCGSPDSLLLHTGNSINGELNLAVFEALLLPEFADVARLFLHLTDKFLN
jgi:hypothetical protein